VGTKAPNGLGIYDMSGNVWEWCHDYQNYKEKYYAESPKDNRRGPSSGGFHGMRGGSWSSGPESVRATNRWGDGPASRGSYGGFRLSPTAGSILQIEPHH